MISRIYRLMDTKRIEMVQREVHFAEDSLIIRLEYMSICAADQRYYLGRRKKEVQMAKLPMALIHEAVGTILYDMRGQLPPGTKVILIPLEVDDSKAGAKDNYREDSRFASSGIDGFMRDIIALPRDRVIPIPGEFATTYVFCEILSVAMGAIQAFEACCQTEKGAFGIWGDGSMGFTMALALRCKYPKAKIYIFGKTARKLQKFSFASETFFIDQIPGSLKIDHGFECVGNSGSELAIMQMIEMAAPQGCLNLLGVSENAIPIATRRILEKGLRVVGNSRSSADDFQEAISLIQSSSLCRRYLHILISEVIEVKVENDIPRAFEQDVLNDFKTVIKWCI